ncbi:hypothetical protein [Vibrio sp. 99-70-13A1]|uniref:hypothetical protein n=1 Tax=Vibrio sp. 99-70-13A1 TaxID=2607601 RepID=UPI0014938EEE|nr:hypothetical protein [Vibrio sp. 99-70-13A1]NOH95744.1 hypothetical protein [Vibrio sp. 99-70-13A1]
MKNRILPIPLILLIPIVLLAIVIVAGVYRFSLTDEEILAKFPSTHVQVDPIVLSVFQLKATNPWTVKVPETNAYAFIDEVIEEKGIAIGGYDSGVERGTVSVAIDEIQTFKDVQNPVSEPLFVAPMWVSNQGSGVFQYIALFKFDKQRSRMILVDQLFIGDRTAITSIKILQETEGSYSGVVEFLQHSASQAKAESPNEQNSITFTFNKQSIVQQ